MKMFNKVMLVSLMFTGVAAKAEVESAPARKILLQSIVSPISLLDNQKINNEVKVITVVGKQVIGATCHSKQVRDEKVSLSELRRCSDIVNFSKLSSEGYQYILSQIREASRGEVKDSGPIFCLAIPTESYTYRANNGKILLASGSRPCAPVFYNDTEAAEALQDLMMNYEKEYETIVDRNY